MATTQDICGDFEEATRIDYGQCRPRRLKRDCDHHRPAIAQIEDPEAVACEDENISTEYDASLTPPIRTITTVFDTECEEILDENDEPVLGPTI